MKNVLILLALLAMTGIVNGALVPNGDFESPDGTAEGWDVWTGGGTVNAHEYTTGGNPDGYVDLEAPAGAGWFGWYQATPLPFEVLGAPAGSTITIQADMKSFDGNLDAAGIKLESVGGTGVAAETEDPITTDWATYSVDLTTDPTNTGLTFSLMCLAGASGAPSTDGFDNCELIVGGKALFPVPNVGALFPDDSTTLTWANPDPNNPAETVTAAAYLLESDVELTDPNLGPDVFDPGVQTLVVTGESADVTGKLTVDKYYYWAVHTTDPNGGGSVTTQGFTWNFIATGDSIPVVDAGLDRYLVTEGTGMVLSLDATVTDDEDAGPVSINWADITDPGDKNGNTTVVFDPNEFVEDPAITLTNTVDGIVEGYYQFEITVDDGVNDPVTDQVAVGVYATCKDAAIGDPDNTFYETQGQGDIDGDCEVTLSDFSLLALSWLDCDASRITCTP